MKKLNLISTIALSLLFSVSCAKKETPTPAPAVPETASPKQEDPADLAKAPSTAPEVSGTHILEPKPPVALPTSPLLIKPPTQLTPGPNTIIGKRDFDSIEILPDQGFGPRIIRRNPSQPSGAGSSNDLITDNRSTEQAIEDLFNPKPGYQIGNQKIKALYLELNELSLAEDRESTIINNDLELLPKLKEIKTYIANGFINLVPKRETDFLESELTRIEGSLGKPLEQLRNIDQAVKDLHEIGFELELYENEYRWREREVTDEFGAKVTWTILLLKSENGYIHLTEEIYFANLVTKLLALSRTVGEYGKEFKDIMEESVLARWRSVNPILKGTSTQIRSDLNI